VPKAGRDKWTKHWLTQGFTYLEEALGEPVDDVVLAKPGRFLVGDSPTMADVFVAPQVYWSQNIPDEDQRIDLAPFPTLKRCYENTLELEAFQKALPDPRLR